MSASGKANLSVTMQTQITMPVLYFLSLACDHFLQVEQLHRYFTGLKLVRRKKVFEVAGNPA